MPIELSVPALVAANVITCPLIQLGTAWLFTRLPDRWFPDRPTAAPPAQLELYESHFRVKRWKGLLPDGASWFAGGFAKKSLTSREPEYLRRFIAETRRGELCHWVQLALAPVFLIWNPWWAFLFVMAWFFVSNLPCIVVQRYNRLRFSRALGR